LKTNKFKFKDIVFKDKGFLRGPFGGDLKKEIFVPKDNTTYKVYEQGVVLQKDVSVGKYYISKDYFDKKMYKFEVKPKDFLVSCSGVNYGAIYQLRENAESGVINQALLRIRLNNKVINDDFFYYYFNFYLVNLIVGKKGDSTIPNFPPINVIKELEFDLPNITIQEKIGYFLKNIDSKIELNNTINKELEAMAKMLYDYWFVQFDFPNENGKPYKSSGGKMVYNQELKRKIPQGWEVKYIEKILERDESKPTIASKNIIYKGCFPVVDQSTDFICGFTNNENAIVKGSEKPRILFGDHTRIVKLINFDFARGADGTQIMISNNDSLPQHFFYQSLLNIDLSNYGYARHYKFLKQSKIIIPQKNIVLEFEKIAENYYKKIKQNIFQNQELSSLRDWLLPMLMNGQVSVK
jgi:type I restriction enzyme S subunit